MTTILEAVRAWLLRCPEIADLYFEAGRAGAGDALLIPTGPIRDEPVRQFLDGSSERRCTCDAALLLPLGDEPGGDTNLEARGRCEAVARWIEAADDAGDLPELPGGCIALSARPSDEGAALLSPGEAGLAARRFAIVIDYWKEA